MFLTTGILLALGATSAEAAMTTNSYAAATSSTAVDPTVRANVNRAAGLASCSSIFVGSDKLPVAVCTAAFTKAPSLMLFDRTGKKVLAKKTLKTPGVAGAMPAYLDQNDRLVIVDGNRVLSRFAHGQWADGSWTFGLIQSAVLANDVATTDRVVGLQPDNSGRVWFATSGGVVGTSSTITNSTHTVRLTKGEKIQQDLSLVSSRIVATTDKAVYKLTASSNGTPTIAVRTAR